MLTTLTQQNCDLFIRHKLRTVLMNDHSVSLHCQWCAVRWFFSTSKSSHFPTIRYETRSLSKCSHQTFMLSTNVTMLENEAWRIWKSVCVRCKQVHDASMVCQSRCLQIKWRCHTFPELLVHDHSFHVPIVFTPPSLWSRKPSSHWQILVSLRWR